jgi:phosphatidylserine/phosphatidylglycerophosphate/cardiolipin synthase-like enzyme
MLFPQSSIDNHFNYVDRHPVAEAYRYFFTAPGSDSVVPHDRPTWDLTSVLCAVRPDEGYFKLSKPGRITVASNGATRFEALEGGLHRFLVLADNQKARTLEAMVMLASQPPVRKQP